MSLAQTFQKLESVQAQRLQVSSGHASPYCYKDSQAHAARRKNRYSDIVPFDRNRVKLRDASNKAAGDYINASMIECSPQRRYIASQGPLEGTAADFWQMVWQDASLILMLCNVTESGRPKCAQYWPDSPSQSETYTNAPGSPIRSFTVTCLESHYDTASDSQVSCLELTHHASAATKQITHLRFCSWPDYGIADLSTLKALISMVERHRSSASVEELPIVHCSAGCGRTGTFIAMSVLQENPSTPIPQLVESLRRQRISMVQSFSQFELLHQFQALCKAEP